ncbi:hypothetical protein L1987_12885 [Smallanthus sonchifolius]|uniref:Uncharacterized protein n=1 Tax=Smallanthus sonchifolius TaxID=185202 RepID=A0ACB9JHD8_9ASTR|nr:hypothetical protein L1987_12885 [Smallanthus sonchifolius]
MGKQTKSRKPDGVIGKGKVTPVQVAFIVDRYLSDNNFVRTRSTFRTEASHLISKSPVNEAPKSLLSLGDMLDEYICLKEQKVMLNQEKNRLEQEKFRVQTLLRGMQDVMNAYNHGGSSASVAAPLPSPMLRPLPSTMPVHKTPVMMSASNSLPEPSNFSTPTTSQPNLKRRKNSKDVPAAPLASKRTRSQPSVKPSASVTVTSNNQENTLQITPVPSTKPSPVQGSSVAKCLFNPGPQTPSPSPTVSPVDDNHTPPSSNKKTVTPQQFTSTNRTVITSETIQVSPMKQVSYYSIERNHCITSPMKPSSKRFTTRDHVKGRLDFDGSEPVTVNSEMLTSDENTESPSEDDAFDFDLPNLDCLGADFNLTDLLGDFDLDANYFCQPDNGSSPESLSGSPGTMVDDSTGDHDLVSEMSSMMTEIRSEQDMSMAGAGPNSVTSVKSITKCIKVISPVKSRST